MIRFTVMLACSLALAGCSTTLGHLPVTIAAPTDAVKMIRPGASADACRTGWLGGSADAKDAALADALAQLKAVDPEVETFQDAQVLVRSLNLGVLRQECVLVRADLVRNVPVLVVDRHHGTH